MKPEKDTNNFDDSYSDYFVTKGKTTTFGLIILLSFFFFRWIIKEHSLISWPNSFEFHTDLQYDSVFVKVCGLRTKLPLLESLEDKRSYGVGNILAPKSGYPCPVEFIVFSDGSPLTYSAPEFNCYGCDVEGHKYILTNSIIEYSTLH